MAFSPYAEILNLRTLTDVDQTADLAQCHLDMQKLEHPTTEQLTLLEAFCQFELPT